MKYQKNETTFDLETWLGKKKSIKAVTKEDYYITVNKKDIRNLNVKVQYKGPIKAPIQVKDKIAELIIFNKDEVIKNIAFVCFRKSSKGNFFQKFDHIN